MTAASTSLSTLPTELLLLVTPHLPRSSLAALISTSRHFRYHLTKSLYTPVSSIFPVAASYACHTSNLPTLQILFAEYGVPINTPIIPSTGQTALHLSAEYGSGELVKWLLEHNANPNQESQHGQPLVNAKTRDVVEMLVEKGAAVEVRNAKGERALDLATRTGRIEVVEALVRKGARVNEGCRDPQNREDENYTPLHAAAEGGHLDIARFLLNAGASPHNRLSTAHWDPLCCACAEGHTEVVNLLIQWGANVNGPGEDSRASEAGRTSERNEVDETDGVNGRTADAERDGTQWINENANPLMLSMEHGAFKEELVRALIEAGADVGRFQALPRVTERQRGFVKKVEEEVRRSRLEGAKKDEEEVENEVVMSEVILDSMDLPVFRGERSTQRKEMKIKGIVWLPMEAVLF
ncbi:ankyrin repeat-containing domain protein [Pyronema omphalodes]|nr:ankyrin repeat-containing domain protein [Pyronema omphalodes]